MKREGVSRGCALCSAQTQNTSTLSSRPVATRLAVAGSLINYLLLPSTLACLPNIYLFNNVSIIFSTKYYITFPQLPTIYSMPQVFVSGFGNFALVPCTLRMRGFPA